MASKAGECLCALCGLEFPSAERLSRHRLKYCQGSALHKALIATREDNSAYLAPTLAEEEVRKLHSGLKALEPGAQQFSVADLMRKLEHEAEDKQSEQRASQLASDRAAERLARERAKAEMQQQLVEAQLSAQRQVELEAKVQLRAAERMATVAAKQKLARQQQRELTRLEQQTDELARRRLELKEHQSGVHDELRMLTASAVAPSDAIVRAQAAVTAAQRETRLSADAERRVFDLAGEHAERSHAAQLERARLLEEQRRLEEQIAIDADDLDAVDLGTSGDLAATGLDLAMTPRTKRISREEAAAAEKAEAAGVRLGRQLKKDEQRLEELEREIRAVRTGAADPLDDVAHVDDAAHVAPPSPMKSVPPPQALPPPSPPSDDAAAPPVGMAAGGVGAFGSGGGVAAQLEQLRAFYANAGGANPALLERISRLEAEARHQAARPPPPAAPTPHVALPMPLAPLQLPGFSPMPHEASGMPPSAMPPQPPSYASQPPGLPAGLQAGLQAAPYGHAALHPPAGGGVAAQLAMLQSSVAAREAEGMQLQQSLAALRSQRAPPDALTTFTQEQQAKSTPRPSTREREAADFSRESLRHERELASVRHERAMVDERLRLASAKEEAAARQEEMEQQREHDKWMATQRRQLAEARVQREIARQGRDTLAPTKLPSPSLPGTPYHPAEGLCLFWDFVLGLPGSSTRLVLVYAVYDGATPSAPIKSLPPVECELEPGHGGLTRSLLAARRQFLHMPPKPSIQMIVELQQVVAPSEHSLSAPIQGSPSKVPPPVTSAIGWCALPLFTHSGALNAGFWRLPVHPPPIALDGSQPARLPVVPHVELCMRVTLTADMERNRDFMVDPDRAGNGLYVLPGEKSPDGAAEADAPASPAKRVSFDAGASSTTGRGRHELRRGTSNVSAFASLDAPAANREPSSTREGAPLADVTDLTVDATSLDAPQPSPGAPPASPPPGPPPPRSARAAISKLDKFDPLLGVSVSLQHLRGYLPDNTLEHIRKLREGDASRIRVHLSLVQLGARARGGLYSEYATPDAGGAWAYEWYSPSTLRPEAASDGLSEAVLLVEVVSERPRKRGGGDGEEGFSADDGAGAPPTASVVGWATLPLFWHSRADVAGFGEGPVTSGFTNKDPSAGLLINSGTHTLPLSPPPVDFSRIGTQLPRADEGVRGELTLSLVTGGDAPKSYQQLLDDLSASVKHDPIAAASAANAARKWSQNANVPPSAWLRSAEPSVPREQAPWGQQGAIIVVDGARFLPDDVVASGIRVSLLDERGSVLAQTPPHAGHCLVLSDARMPKFQAKLLVGGNPPANATLAIAVNAMVSGVEEAVSLGYGLLPLFVRHGDPSLTQPTDANEGGAALNLGCFQLPLHLGSELALAHKGVVLNEHAVNGEPRLPCATVLVRVLPGGLPPTLASAPADRQAAVLESMRVPPPPTYMSGAYDTSRCVPLKHEVALYKPRLQRPPVQGVEAVQDEADARDEQVSSVEDADAWLNRHLDAPEVSEVYDLRSFAPYDPAAGIQVMARCASGLPNAAITFACISVYPPAGLYAAPRSEDVTWRVTDEHDWSADMRSPKWLTGGQHIPNVPYDEGGLLIVDVRCLEKPTVSSSLKDQGWAVLPLFVDRVVDSGLHQLPLLTQRPDATTLAALSKAASKSIGEWHKEVASVSRRRGLGIVEGASVTVTLLDAQRYDEYERPETLPPRATPDRVRLPQALLHAYVKEAPPSKPLSSLVGKIRASKAPPPPEEPAKKRGGLFGGGAASTKPPMLTQEELNAEAFATFKLAMGLDNGGWR